jgi:hypothetical protein
MKMIVRDSASRESKNENGKRSCNEMMLACFADWDWDWVDYDFMFFKYKKFKSKCSLLF